MQPVPVRPQLGGFIFDSLKPDGDVERSISLMDTKLSIMRADYQSWERTWGDARETFVLMLPVLLERSAVVSFHLQYHDRFICGGEHEHSSPRKVLRPESHWLTPKVFEAGELWHSHYGFFEYPDQPHRHQLLNVVETQLIPVENVQDDLKTELAIDVKQNHRVIHGVERAGGHPDEAKTAEEILGVEGGTGLIDAYMDEMHDRNKQILAQLINDEMCDRIKLDRPS